MVLLASLSLGCGLILDSVARGRKELKRLHYLSIPPRRGPEHANSGHAPRRRRGTAAWPRVRRRRGDPRPRPGRGNRCGDPLRPEQTGVSRHVIVVDQGSRPEALALLAETVRERDDATLVALDHNHGVPGGRNVGNQPRPWPASSSAWTTMPCSTAPDTLARMKAAFDADPDLGALGCRIVRRLDRRRRPVLLGLSRRRCCPAPRKLRRGDIRRRRSCDPARGLGRRRRLRCANCSSAGRNTISACAPSPGSGASVIAATS